MVFCLLLGSWRPFWGSTPRCLRLADLLLRWEFRVGFGGFLLQISCYPTLVFYLVPAQLPLRCFPFGVLRPCRVRRHVCLQFAGLPLGLCWKGVCCATWFFSHVPCSSSGPAACAAFPDAGSLGVFRSPGVCPSASLVTWVRF